MLHKMLALGGSVLLSLGALSLTPPPEPAAGPPPPPKKKGDRPGPADDLQKAYTRLRVLRADIRSHGRSETRIREWTERAVQYYRDGIRAQERDDPRLAHEYGAIAHELARASEHAHRASLLEREDDDLPRPPRPAEFDDVPEPVTKDLRKTYDRLTDEDGVPGSKFYSDAARDLYNAARGDAQAGRYDRAGELAHAADAMTHVIEHLGHIHEGPDRPEPKRRDRPEPKKKDRPEPREKDRRDDRLPPPL
jgi:hypothetical protein